MRESTRIIQTLVEGDIYQQNGDYFHVTSGEVQVYSDRTLDLTNGEVAEVSQEALLPAITSGKHIVNIDE